MREERVFFPARGARDIRLEGLFLDGGGRPLVISHPHPLHGGSMDHPVVLHLWRAAGEAGYRALRYNYRGVGASTGGLTEKSPLPLGDLGGAVDFLGGGPVFAAGYSYGARTTLHALLAGERFEKAALIGLPTRLPANSAAMSDLILGRKSAGERHRPSADLELLAGAPRPLLVVAGARDPLFQAEEVRSHGIEPVLLPGVNHFFSRRLGNQEPDASDMKALCEVVLAFLR